MKKCIYCLKEDGPFKREHVLPQQIGTYLPTSPILYDHVCAECNNYFSAFEGKYCVNSFENLCGLMYGIIQRKEIYIPNSDKRQVQLLFGGTHDETWERGFPSVKLDTNDLYFKSQLILFLKGGGVHVFFYDALLDMNAALGKKLDKAVKSLDGGYFVIASNDDELNYMQKLLDDKGVNVKKREIIEKPSNLNEGSKIQFKGSFFIDSLMKRFPAKVAFNYFAYCAVESGTFYEERLYSCEFSDVRRFVLGEEDDKANEIVQIVSKSPWRSGDASISIDRVLVHMIGVRCEDGKLFCYFSPFNRVHYKVLLGESPFGQLINSQINNGVWFAPPIKKYGKMYPGTLQSGPILTSGSIFSLV